MANHDDVVAPAQNLLFLTNIMYFLQSSFMDNQLKKWENIWWSKTELIKYMYGRIESYLAFYISHWTTKVEREKELWIAIVEQANEHSNERRKETKRNETTRKEKKQKGRREAQNTNGRRRVEQVTDDHYESR